MGRKQFSQGGLKYNQSEYTFNGLFIAGRQMHFLTPPAQITTHDELSMRNDLIETGTTHLDKQLAKNDESSIMKDFNDG